MFVFFSFQEQEQELTPEDEIAEKLRLKKLQEDSDLELANDAFGEFWTPVKFKFLTTKIENTMMCFVT